MNKYKIGICIEGNWGQKWVYKYVYAINEVEAESEAYEILDKIEVRFDEDNWGAYEEARIEDIILVGC